MTEKEWVRSISVFPLKPKDKTPAVPSWKKYELARPTEEELAEWKATKRGANWAMACGPVSGYVVLDFDGEAGERFLVEHGLDEDAPGDPPRVRTNGGVHLYYAWPGDAYGSQIPNKARIAPGVDIRTKGGYVVIPPSTHPSGKKYEWIVPPWEREAPSLPFWFDKLVVEYNAKKGPVPAPESRAPSGETGWQRWLEEDCGKGTEGGRHGRAAELAGVLLNKFKPPQAQAMLSAWNTAHCKPPLSAEEIEKLVADFAKTRTGFPDDPEKPKAIPLHRMTAQELHESQSPPRDIIVDPWLSDLDHVILCGESKMGKSVVALALAFALVTRTDFYGFPCQRHSTVTYVDVENGRIRQKDRQAKLISTHGFIPEGLSWVFAPEGIDLDSQQGLDALESVAGVSRFLILDPFLCFYPRLKSENDNAEVRRVLNKLGYWATKHGRQIIMVDHSSSLSEAAMKAGEKVKARGATAKENWASVVITLEGKETKTLRWKHTRDCREPHPVKLLFEGPMLVQDYSQEDHE